MPHTLLLADDSVTIQRVIELTFADEDVQVVAVSDGDQAIARLDAQLPDIVLADIGMPGKNGYEVARYIKHSPRLAHIPVVLLTGAFEPVDQVKAAEAGCDGVLAKPFEPQLVIGRVKELLGRSRRALASLDAPSAPAAVPVPAPWTPPVTEPSVADAAAPAGLDDYFDRLDAAFASLSGPSRSEPQKPGAPVPVDDDAAVDRLGPQASPPAPVDDRWDTLSAASSGGADLPLSHGLPQAGVLRTPAPPPRTPTPVPPPAGTPRQVLPPLADAFAALLAAEQNVATTPEAAAWPATPPLAPLVTDDLVEQVSTRVLERLSDRVVRDTVADLVSAIAERLVREEIERIKASIK